MPCAKLDISVALDSRSLGRSDNNEGNGDVGREWQRPCEEVATFCFGRLVDVYPYELVIHRFIPCTGPKFYLALSTMV